MLSASISTRACSREHALLVKQPPRSNGGWATLQTCRLLMRLSTVSFANMACNSFLTKPQRFPTCTDRGRIVISVWRSIEHCPWQAAIADAVERNMGSEQAAQIRSAFSFGEADQLQQVIIAAGFRGVEIRIERETIRHASMAEYVPGYISATPVAAAVAGLDTEAQAKITTDVRDALAAYRVGDGLAAPIEAHVAIGYR